MRRFLVTLAIGSAQTTLGTKPSERSSAEQVDRLVFRLVVAAVALGAAVLLRLTWLKWGDPVVDVGRELEIARKITTGRVLYRDMAYIYGPFSPYLNALFLKTFGIHVTSIVLSGLLSAAVGTVLVYLVCREFLDRTASACVVAVFLLESVFQHYVLNGSYTFILPYSFPAVHGTLFALAALLFLLRYLRTSGRGKLVLTGVAAGFCGLCKIEIAAAILAPVALFTFLKGWRTRRRPRDLLRLVGAWAVPVTVVLTIGFLPLIASSSFDQVVWKNMLKLGNVDPRSSEFFARVLGLHKPGKSVVAILSSLGLWAVIICLIGCGSAIAARGLASHGEGSRRTRRVVSALVFGVYAVIAATLLFRIDTVFRGLPVVGIGTLLVAGARLRSSSVFDEESARIGALALFALLAMARIAFNVGTYHYGFYLALPGVLLFSVFLLRLLPQWFPAMRATPGYHTFFCLALLLSLSLKHFVTLSLPQFMLKTTAVSSPRGRLMAYPVVPHWTMRRAVAYLVANAEPTDTLVVLPEGGMANFLTGLENPTYYDVFVPTELAPPGVEERVIEQLERTRVDRILVIERDMTEYGLSGIFVDYGMKLRDYVLATYDAEALCGAPPFLGRGNGCLLLKRRRVELGPAGGSASPG